MARVQKYGFTRRMFTRPARKTLVLNTICTLCCTQTVYYICLLCVKYGMHAYAGPACICRMHAPSMLFPPTQDTICAYHAYRQHSTPGTDTVHSRDRIQWSSMFSLEGPSYNIHLSMVDSRKLRNALRRSAARGRRWDTTRTHSVATSKAAPCGKETPVCHF